MFGDLVSVHPLCVHRAAVRGPGLRGAAIVLGAVLCDMCGFLSCLLAVSPSASRDP